VGRDWLQSFALPLLMHAKTHKKHLFYFIAYKHLFHLFRILGLLLSMSENFLIGKHLAKYKQERDCLVHFLRLLAVCWPGTQSARNNSLLFVTLPNIHRLKIFFTRRLSNKHFLIWLLTTPSHLKYVATLPCNLSLMACFADIYVLQGSVATYARCGGSFSIRITTNLPWNFPVK